MTYEGPKTYEEITCPSCNGGGQAYEPTPQWAGEGLNCRLASCPRCGGSGVVVEAA